MRGSCSVSKKVCYSCREHEMRPKNGGSGGAFKGAFRSRPGLGKRSKQYTALLLSWTGGQMVSEDLTEINCLAWVLEVSLNSILTTHQHLSSLEDAENWGVMKQEKKEGGREWQRAHLQKTLGLKTRPMDLWFLLPGAFCLCFSRHV